MASRGKSIALLSVGIGALVLGAFAIVGKDKALELSWLHQLATGSREAKGTAIARLGRLRSAKAARPIAEAAGRALILRRAAMEALKRIGAGAAPGLVEALGSGDRAVRRLAGEALKPMDLKGGPLVSFGIWLLEDGNGKGWPERLEGVETLRKASPLPPRAIEALTKALGDADSDVFLVNAAELLAQQGAAAKAAIPALVQRACTPEQGGPVLALLKFGQAAVPMLASEATSTDPRHRAGALAALSYFGPKALPALDVITRGTLDPDVNVCLRALQALENMGPCAAASVSAVFQALENEQPSVRGKASRTLIAIGPAAVPAVVEFRRDDEHRYRRMGEEVHGSPPMSKP